MCGFCFVVGCIFSYFTVKTGSFWPAVVAHGALNGFAGVSIYFCNSIAPDPFVGPLPTGIIGGAFLIIVGLICFIKLKVPRRRRHSSRWAKSVFQEKMIVLPVNLLFPWVRSWY